MAATSITRNMPATQGWVECAGNGRPVPKGTLVDVRRFNGEVDRIHAGEGPTVAPDGTIIDRSQCRWSAWDHNDGGPMAPKFKAYRIVTPAETLARNTAMFREWLNVRQEELA